MKNRLVLLLSILFSTEVSIGQADSLLLKKHVYMLAADSLNGRGFGSTDGLKAAKYIINQFQEAGIKPFQGSFNHSFSYRMGSARVYGQNIIGVIEGSDPVLKNEYIVFGAHYDHMGYSEKDHQKTIYNGADDNASGTATIIEMGRVLMQHPETFKRSILLIAFDGEESGLIGSTYLVENKILPIEKIKAMFSIDMVGMLSTNEGISLKGSSTLAVGDGFFTALAQNYPIEIKKMGSEIENRTDTKPFGDVGIPAIAITTGLKSPYHKPDDDANLLDYAGMATITSFICDVAQKLSAQETIAPAAILAKSGAKSGEPFITYGMVLNLGKGYYMYSDEFYRSKAVFASEAGLYTRIHLYKRFAIQPAIMYQLSGGRHPQGVIYTQSITTPVSLYYSLIKNSDVDAKINIFFGGYYSYTFEGKNIDLENDLNSVNNSDNYGLIYGLDFEVQHIIVGLTIENGLSEMITGSNNSIFKARNTYLTLGYRF